MNCVLLNVIFDLYREQWPNSTIAFLPIIDAADVPIGMTEREFKLYKAEIEAACLEKVLFPVLDKDHVFNVVDITGASRNVVAVLHSWVADFMEQVTLAGLIGLTGCSRLSRCTEKNCYQVLDATAWRRRELPKPHRMPWRKCAWHGPKAS
jgi:hypothetical protein